MKACKVKLEFRRKILKPHLKVMHNALYGSEQCRARLVTLPIDVLTNLAEHLR